MLKSEVLGQYNPSFFSIEICTNDATIDAINSPTHCHTFIHEYLHFLQDIILPYPMRCCMQKLFLLRSAIDQMKEEGVLHRPIEYNQVEKDEIKTFNATFGCEAVIDNIKSIIDIKKLIALTIDKSGPAQEPVNVYEYIAIVEDMNKKTYEYILGARDLLEYMASKIEKKFFTEAPNCPDAPYNIPDYIFQYFGLHNISTSIKLCIIEASLYNDNPMNRLLFYIETLKKDSPESLLNICKCKETLTALLVVSRGGYAETKDMKSQRRFKQFIEYLTEMYDPNGANGIKSWIDHIPTFTDTVDSFFFTDLFIMERDTFIDKIEELYKELGTPLVYNQKKQILMSLPYTDNYDDFFIFIATLSFFEFIENSGENICPMHSFCSSNNSQIILK